MFGAVGILFSSSIKWLKENNKMLRYNYLTDKQLQGLRNYKYSAIDTNPLGKYVLQPYLKFMIRYVPLQIAPNLITFTGFLFASSSFLLLTVLDYHFFASSDAFPYYKTIPKWAFLYAGIAVFLNHLLDGLDGIQARRTGTSSPLGELFDHGLDSWTTVMIPSLIFSIFGRADFGIHPFGLYLICWSVFCNFYLSHVEKYITGVLYLPWSYDYSMLGTVVLFLFTAFVGHRKWKYYLFGNWTLANILEVIFYLGTFTMNIPIVAWNVYRSYRDKTGKNLRYIDASKPLWPFLTLFAFCFTWITFSPVNIIEKDPRAVYIITGTIFSNICCRLIISQMSGTRCNRFAWMSVPVLSTVCANVFLPSYELPITYTLVVLTLALHVHYGVCVIKQICEYFGIDCFHIKVRQE